jgi:hypothetical protein
MPPIGEGRGAAWASLYMYVLWIKSNDLLPIYGNMAVKMAVVTNLVAVKGLQVAVNFGEGGSEGLPRSGNPASTSTGLSICSQPGPANVTPRQFSSIPYFSLVLTIYCILSPNISHHVISIFC